ncbi:MAG: hypothetical protein IJX24_06990 [Oscillospiraceae bacterium]|nr:hypothetical protein [Oscillospiraceae bacterium]
MYKSTKDKVNQKYETAEFSEINGRILRNLNVLDDKKPKISAFITLFNDIEFTAFSECINYLSLSGYIKLINIYTNKDMQFESKEFNNMAVRLTAKGIKLLKGKAEDNAVNI